MMRVACGCMAWRTAASGPVRTCSPEGWRSGFRSGMMGSGQQDHASDERGVEATEAREQPRFEAASEAHALDRPARA
jgi:hypothetical protein